jgi:O-antigen/teichoic acid export membrane protein
VSDERLSFPAPQLRRRVARGAIVNGVYLSIAEGLVLVQGLVVTVVLGPRQMGLSGIVAATAVTIAQLRRVGIDEAFVAQDEPDQEVEFQRAFSLDLAFSSFFALVILLAAPIVAVIYGDWRLLPLTAAVAYLPIAFALQAPTWVFARRMDFVRQRRLLAVVPIVTFVVTVPLAAAGAGVWSLIIGPFVGSVAGAVVAIRASPYRLTLRFDRDARRRYVRFSWPVFAVSLLVLVQQQGQVLAFDTWGGLTAAGYITMAATLTRYADRADLIIGSTIYPAICAVRDRIETLEELFVKSSRLTLAWSLPLCAGFVLFSPDFVTFVLGDEWEGATVLLQGMGAAAGLQQIGFIWFTFYRARGQTGPYLVEFSILTGSFLALAVPGLFLFGAAGFVWGRLIGVAIGLGVRRHYVRRLLPNVSLAALGVRALAPILAGGAAAAALRLALWGGSRGAAQAVAEIALFLAVTAAVTWALERELLAEAVDYLRRRRESTDSGAPLVDPVAS